MSGPDAAPVLYAFTLGLVAAVNPCGFPLLPAYLTLLVGDGGEAPLGPPAGRRAPGGLVVPARWHQRMARGLVAGLFVTVGFLMVFGVVGGVIESGVRVLMTWVPWVMIPLGAFLVVGGAMTVAGKAPYLRMPNVSLQGRRGMRKMVAFGVAYAVASLTCALPLFLAGVAGSFGRLGLGDGMATVVAYALGMGLFLTVASMAVALLGAPALRRLRPMSRVVPRLGGVVLALVGAYLVYYWASNLADPLSTPAIVGWVEHVQSSITAWLSSAPRAIGLALGAVFVVALGALFVAVRRTEAHEGTTASSATSGGPSSGDAPSVLGLPSPPPASLSREGA